MRQALLLAILSLLLGVGVSLFFTKRFLPFLKDLYERIAIKLTFYKKQELKRERLYNRGSAAIYFQVASEEVIYHSSSVYLNEKGSYVIPPGAFLDRGTVCIPRSSISAF